MSRDTSATPQDWAQATGAKAFGSTLGIPALGGAVKDARRERIQDSPNFDGTHRVSLLRTSRRDLLKLLILLFDCCPDACLHALQLLHNVCCMLSLQPRQIVRTGRRLAGVVIPLQHHLSQQGDCTI